MANLPFLEPVLTCFTYLYKIFDSAAPCAIENMRYDIGNEKRRNTEKSDMEHLRCLRGVVAPIVYCSLLSIHIHACITH